MKGNRHVVAADWTPVANLWLSVANLYGVRSRVSPRATVASRSDSPMMHSSASLRPPPSRSSVCAFADAYATDRCEPRLLDAVKAGRSRSGACRAEAAGRT